MQRRVKNGSVLAIDRKSPSFAQTAKDGPPSSSFVQRPNDENPRRRRQAAPTRAGGMAAEGLLTGGIFFAGQAVVADAADCGAGDGDLHFEVVGNLFFQLFVQAGFEFADLAAAEAGDVDVVARTVGFIVVAV